MYYIFLCWLSRIKYIATPMGSDVLVRPKESNLYKFFTSKSLSNADKITVDSKSLFNEVLSLSNKKSIIIQNGIDTKELLKFNKKNRKSFIILYQYEDFIQIIRLKNY